MQAVTLERFGPPEVLALGERPDPTPPPGWVLVELHAAALNWHDCLLRQGVYPHPLPRIPGSDGAGVRTDTGEPVLILPSLGWGTRETHPAPGWEILGDLTDGTYAELVTVPAENVVPRPRGWSAAEAAALGLAGLTAFRALVTRGRLSAGESVLILGAGGGVAAIAVGLARMLGADVLVTTSTPAKLAAARITGARDGVLYSDPDWPDQVRELTGGRGVDLVVDSVGSTWPGSLGCLAPGGRLVVFGATGGDRAEVDIRRFYFAQQTILGTTMGSPRDFAGLLSLISTADPAWRPPIDRSFGLDDLAAAHTLMEARGHTGKLVIDITGRGGRP